MSVPVSGEARWNRGAFAASSLHIARMRLERLFFLGGNMADNEKLATIRHSMAHVMAEAVLDLFPDTKIAIGPAIENGFYYDFDFSKPIVDADLERITERMKEIIASGVSFERKEVSREEAKAFFADQPYKLELIDAIPEGETVSMYTQGGFTDLCRGPHVKSTKELNKDSFKLLSIAGAYWRGSEKNPMLTRIYGTAWSNPKELRDRGFLEKRALQEWLRACIYASCGTQLALGDFRTSWFLQGIDVSANGDG